MKRFSFEHIIRGGTGYIVVLRIGKRAYAGWLGYGKPVWWKPRFLKGGKGYEGFGFGWLLLCFRVAMVGPDKESDGV